MPEPEEKKPERLTDPEALARALEMELILQRASWQQSPSRRGLWRALSLLFLLLVILGALFVYFYMLPQLRHRGNEAADTPAAERSR